MRHSSSPIIAIIVIVAVIVIYGVSTIVARKKGYSGVGGNTIVRCSKGHLFTTIWLPGGSFKAIRLGTARFQHCPVGNHWALVKPVKVSELTDEEKKTASENKDTRIP